MNYNNRLDIIKKLIKTDIVTLDDIKIILNDNADNLVSNFLNIYADFINHSALTSVPLDYKMFANLKNLILQCFKETERTSLVHIIPKLKKIQVNIDKMEGRLDERNLNNDDWKEFNKQLRDDVKDIYDNILDKDLSSSYKEQYNFVYSIIFEMQNKNYLYHLFNKYPYLVNIKSPNGEHIMVEIVRTYTNLLIDNEVKDFTDIIYFQEIINVFFDSSRFRIKDEDSQTKIKELINNTMEVLDGKELNIKNIKQKKLFLDFLNNQFEFKAVNYSNIKEINQKYGIFNGFNFSVQKELGLIREILYPTYITIDCEETKDMDDAISLRKVDDYYIVDVCISDVEHIIKEGTNLDLEAYSRASSIYLSDNIIPMFPFELSNEILSLNDNGYKTVICFSFKMDKDGNVIDSTIYRKNITIASKLSYKKVDEMLIQGKPIDVSKEIYEMLWNLSLLASSLRNKNRVKDSYREIKEMRLKSRGGVLPVEDTSLANIIIEEFMVLANTTAAKTLSEHGYPCIYRVHPKIENTKEYSELRRLEGELKNSDFNDNYQKIMEELVSLYPKAYYSANNIGHFGLNLPYYSHATSPIRRYADIVMQRLINDFFFEYPSNETVYYWEERIKEVCKRLNEQAVINEAYLGEYEKYKKLTLEKGE